ncbi:MAG: hypothetical protein MJ016_07860 [Victivallaceae bacterium]|nr:hypothetical protein [Victivallaceae bacterium]
MKGFQFRQGTVYRKKEDGSRLLLIHHDPMNLESIVVPGDERHFDAKRPALISIDSLIALRKSGQYEEVGDLDAETLHRELQRLLAGGALTEKAAKLVAAVVRELPR